MTLYRVRSPIARGEEVIAPGTIIRAGELKPHSIQALVRRGALVELLPPPLSVLPGWSRRAELLAQLGITDAGGFLNADIDEVARHVGVSPGLVSRWQSHVEAWLTVPPDEGSHPEPGG